VEPALQRQFRAIGSFGCQAVYLARILSALPDTGCRISEKCRPS